jgi:hypothetical protein
MRSELPKAQVIRGGEPFRGKGEVAAQVLRLAPRRLPRRLVWQLLFGTTVARFGWMFAAFGMVGTLAAVPRIALVTPTYDRTARATVTQIEESGSSENDRPIYRIRFSFRDERGRQRQGASYSQDKTFAGSADVEYAANDPTSARLVGTDHKPFGWWLMFILVFPVAGLAIALPQLRAGLHQVRLLRHGREVRGRLVEKRETSVSVNDEPVMAMTFEYEVDGTNYRATVTTLTPSTLEDDPLEPMVYDPTDPAHATTLDHLPGSVHIGPDGELESKPGIAVHVLIMPAITVGLIVATFTVLVIG